MDKIGLVTITYNSAIVLQQFLDCVWDQTHNNLVLYVIDNASKDATCSILRMETDPRLRIINNSINFGVAKANNQGIESAIADGCDQVLIINNDVEFEANLIQKLIQVQSQRSCSLVAPKMMYFDKPDHIWYAGSWFARMRGYLPLHRGIKQLDRGQYDEVSEVEYAPTCCLLVRKEVFLDIGLMDEKYFVYFDDTDFLYRVWKDKRHKLFYMPDVKFYHKVGSLTNSFNKQDNRTFRSDFFLQQTTKHHIYFLKKVGGLFAYTFIVWLFFRNNISFILSPYLRRNFRTWLLINKSYFKGIRM